MKSLSYIIMVIAGFCIAACNLNPSDKQLRGKDENTPYQIAVLFSYSQHEKGYLDYKNELEVSLKDAGIDAELHPYYLNLTEGYDPNSYKMKGIVDSLKANHIDLVITEGTVACYQTISYLNKEQQNHYPLISGGVSVQVWDSLKTYPNIHIWIDEIDYPRLIDMAAKFWKSNVVTMELDHNFLDDKQREDVQDQINRPPYINNIELKSREKINQAYSKYQDSIVVVAYSASDWQSNTFGDTQENLTQDLLLRFANQIPALTVKKDIYSEMQKSSTNKPQVTALPYDFGTNEQNYLAGVFVQLKDEANDVANTVIEILKGTANNSITAGRHKRSIIMDYLCMQKFHDLKYDDYVEEYTIINAPYEVSNARQHLINEILVGCVVIGIISFCINMFIRYKRKHIVSLKDYVLHSNLQILAQQPIIFNYEYGVKMEVFAINNKDNLNYGHIVYEDRMKDLPHPDHRDRFSQFMKDCLLPGNHELDLSFTLNRGIDYHWYRMRYVTQEIYDKMGNRSYHITGIATNIDILYQQKEKIETARFKAEEMRMKEDFIRNVNHEIRTPLNSVLGFCDILADSEMGLSCEEKAEFCRTIKHNANRLNNLVTDILMYSRLESGRLKLNCEKIRVDQFMEIAVEAAQEYIGSSLLIDDNGNDKTGKLSLNYQPGWGDHEIYADPNQLKMIYSQLISNAVKYSNEGQIHTGWYLELKTKQIMIYVEDQGIGMTDEEQKHIFKFFFKGNHMNRGIGLGLSISHALLEKMDGQLYVRSQKNMGSRFVILMPLA